ncbi:pirin family protein [Mucilaginibacter myungsuensis]|uniref:Quercetin 2,3-dioxygenase C-terminal cupin domain-containing protein n=1 Tax=Mucilaginibacter myungsuensis TaxID=649104 RepID=A0A929KY65_9SPHI|nr:hypothetical protein [Mucilaginibacter myungsuensis]MBE9662822.1 hypothetical protein [Mucilaginibacter myungsuensis]MDN3598242.1 hypothetical protein [Mucilaginibacter myungsuensis]
MEKLSPGQIHLADQRGVTEQGGLTRWSTLNYGDYQEAERKPFGKLLTLNDELFAPSHSQTYQPKQNSFVVIVPITGEVGINGDAIDVGQVYQRYIEARGDIKLSNPYTDEQINFLYLEFQADGSVDRSAQILEFDLDGKQNQLVPITIDDDLPFSMHIGMFDGRADAIYQLKNTGGLFYAFVIAGAFELQGRLMHQRDGLALWDLTEADMEALSNNAVVLVIGMVA